MPNPNTLLVATGSGLALSSDVGNHFASVLGGSIDDIHLDTTITASSATPQTVLAAVGQQRNLPLDRQRCNLGDQPMDGEQRLAAQCGVAALQAAYTSDNFRTAYALSDL
jgi:hypothetical protein